jgi:hypothetical protein
MPIRQRLERFLLRDKDPLEVSSRASTPDQTASTSAKADALKNTRHDITKMTWSGLRALGLALKAGASTFGPLKDAVEAIDGCMEIFEVRVHIMRVLRLSLNRVLN